MSLRIVPDETSGPLPYDEANAEFKEHWTAARNAYADLLNQSGSLAHPLYSQGGGVTAARIRAALYSAEQISKHAAAVMSELVACSDLMQRAVDGARGGGAS